MAHHSFAGVAELADALDLGSSASRRGGSTPFTRTISKYSRKQFRGRTSPCQGEGRGFKSRLSLQQLIQCRGGGTGRRTGLKILRQQYRTGSIPVLGTIILAPIAQLDRAFDYGSKGQGFDSSWARHLKTSGSSSAWQSTWFGTKGSQVRILSSRPLKIYINIINLGPQLSWESACFARRRSAVRSRQAPPF